MSGEAPASAGRDARAVEDAAMGAMYQRFPVTVERGEGARVWDSSGREYLDFMGGYGVALVGHRNARVTEAIREQAGRIVTVHGSLYSNVRAAFLERLVSLAPRGLECAHLNNSGAEAVEAAIKFARKFTRRPRIVAMRGSYHGKSLGALSLTFSPKYRRPFEPLVEGVEFVPFGDAGAAREAITDDVGMVIVEPIQGESGIHVAPDGFLRGVREACDERGAVLAFDEIQAGLGRTGRMWACDHDGVAPDILCLAKGIAGGVPMGVTLARAEIVASMSRGEHSSTFGGNALSCAAGSATLEALTADGLVGNAAAVGRELHDGLARLARSHPSIREVRGRGLMVGIELRFDVREIIMGGIERGVLLLYSGRNTLRLLPPLVITRGDVARVLGALDGLLSEEEARRGIA